MNLDMRHDPAGFRLRDFVVRCLAFDRRERGPNSSLSYIVATTPRGSDILYADDRTPTVRVTKMVRGIASAEGWLFLPYCVFGDDVVRCAGGTKISRRPPRERDRLTWIGRAKPGDCAGFIVGREDDLIVVRPAFHEWFDNGDCAIVVADDLGGLERPLTAFVAGFALSR